MAMSTLSRCSGNTEGVPRSDRDQPIACPCRAVFRDFVNSTMLSQGLREISEKLFPAIQAEADRLLIDNNALAIQVRQLFDQVQSSRGSEIEALCHLIILPANPAEARCVMSVLFERVMEHRTGSGRLLALVLFSAMMLCRCADKGEDYVRVVLRHVEDDIDRHIHVLVEQAERQVRT